MFQDKTIIRQIPDDYAKVTGLDKYNRSRMPKTFDRLCPALNSDGRYITGFDEDSISVKLIGNLEERKDTFDKLKTIRETLEKETGLDLSGTSKYWEDYQIPLSADQDKILNGANPHDAIMYHVLVANAYVAPSKDISGSPKYANAKYYAFTVETENKDKVSARKLKDQAKAELFKIAEKKDSMIILGQYLEGPKYDSKVDVDTLYSMLGDYIDTNKENTERFLKAVKKDRGEMQFKIVVDKALRGKIIKFKDKYYQRGQVTLGKNIEELYKNLSSPEYAAEYESIKDELESRN
jgi:hypothetical protein